jgi:hypothetical protein
VKQAVDPDEHEANRETARQIQLQRPGWMVMYGTYSRQYIAFPLFRAPKGTIVAAGHPPALAAQMQAVEQAARQK